MAEITASLGARAVLGKLHEAARKIPQAITQGLEAAGRIYLNDQALLFDKRSAGAPGWAPLAESTQRRKGGPTPILEETRQLRQSLEPGAQGNVLRVVGDRLIVGTTDRTAAYHQNGTPNMPARPVLGYPTPGAVRMMRLAVQSAIANVIAQARTSTGGGRSNPPLAGGAVLGSSLGPRKPLTGIASGRLP